MREVSPQVEQGVQKYISEVKEAIGDRPTVLQEVDFPILEEIFKKMLIKCGITGEGINFLGPERIVADYRYAGYGGSYSPEGNVIKIYDSERAQNLIGFLREEGVEEDDAAVKEFKRLAGISALIHEETHAVARSVCVKAGEGSSKYAPEGRIVRQQLGYQIDQLKDPSQDSDFVEDVDSFFAAFNEAITEMIAREIFYEYLQANGLNSTPGAKFAQKYLEGKHQYNVFIVIAEKMADKIARKTGQSRDAVLQAFKRGMIEGEVITQGESREWFEEIFTKDFFSSLEKLDTYDYDAAANFIDEWFEGELGSGTQ